MPSSNVAIFILLSTILFGGLFLVWQKSDWLNFVIKAGLFGMMVYGIVILITK
jgi:hypothetical protein